MERLDGHDELLSRIAAVDPAARLAPMTEGALERVSRRVMHPAPKAWTWRRYRLASLGALVGSGGLVIAGILGIQSAAQNLPILALGQSHAAKAGPNAPASNALMMPYESFQFTADPSLSSDTGTGAVYELSSSIDGSTAASQVAQALGVSGDVTSSGDGSFQVGPDNGPDVSTWTSSGIVSFDYESASPVSISSPDAAPTTTTVPAGPLPTNDQAAQRAVALLGSLGVTSDLGAPSVSNYGTEVDVTIPIVVDGLATDQTFYVAYGPNSVLNSVSGEIVTATAETTYPTISQTDAVNVVIAHNGFVYCGGVMPLNAAASTGSTGASSSGSTSTTVGPPSGAVGDSSPPFTTPTTTPTTIPEPVVDVDINQATMQLATFSLTDGTSWLLPSWALSGPESGTSVTSGSTYTANVMAVDAQYVQLQACPMVF